MKNIVTSLFFRVLGFAYPKKAFKIQHQFHFLYHVMSFIFCVSALLFLFIQSIELVAFTPDNYFQQFEKLGIASELGTTDLELHKVVDNLVGYMQGKADNLDVTFNYQGEQVGFFNEREKSHMIDVLKLFNLASIVKTVALWLMATIFVTIVALKRKLGLLILSRTMILVAIDFVVLLLLLAFWFAIDFSSFWNFFHMLSFSNDLWLLDPDTDRMIVMLPLSFFFAFVIKIVYSIAVGFMLLLLIAAIIFLNFRENNSNAIFKKM